MDLFLTTSNTKKQIVKDTKQNLKNMKKIKLIAMSALAFVTIASAVFVSCNKKSSTPDEAVTTKRNINAMLSVSVNDQAEFTSYIKTFSREITVYDANHANSVVLNLSSENEATLNEYISSQKFSIDALYTVESAPETPETEVPTEDNSVPSTNCVTSIVTSTNLDNNAVGYRLNMTLKNRASSQGGNTEPGFTGMTEHITLANGIVTTYTGNVVGGVNNFLYVEKWAKKKSLSSWSFKGDGYLGAYPMNTSMNYCIKNQNRIMVHVNYNWIGTYSVSFYGSSSC